MPIRDKHSLRYLAEVLLAALMSPLPISSVRARERSAFVTCEIDCGFNSARVAAPLAVARELYPPVAPPARHLATIIPFRPRQAL